MSESDSTAAERDSDSPRQRASEVELSAVPNGITVLVSLALLTFAGLGLHFIQDVFTPIFLALTLVLALRPVSQFFVRKGFPAWCGATVVIILLLFLVFAMVGITVWSLTPVPQTLLRYSHNFEATTTSVLDWLQARNIQVDDLTNYIESINFNSVVSWLWNLIDQLSSIGGLLAIVVIAVVFLALDTAVTKSRAAVVDVSHAHIGKALLGFERRVRHYWIVSTFFGLMVALLDGVALEMMSIPLVWTWVYWAFITNYIPNIGFFIGVIPPMLMALLDQGWQTMIWVLVIYCLINVVIQTFIQPKFTGDVVGLSPTVTFISLVLWTTIVGILGSILAVPLTLFFKALLVDSDPRTRWLDAFLISEKDASNRKDRGLYDLSELVDDTVPHLHYPFDMGHQHSGHPLNRPKLSSLTRQLKRASKKDK